MKVNLLRAVYGALFFLSVADIGAMNTEGYTNNTQLPSIQDDMNRQNIGDNENAVDTLSSVEFWRKVDELIEMLSETDYGQSREDTLCLARNSKALLLSILQNHYGSSGDGTASNIMNLNNMALTSNLLQTLSNIRRDIHAANTQQDDHQMLNREQTSAQGDKPAI